MKQNRDRFIDRKQAESLRVRGQGGIRRVEGWSKKKIQMHGHGQQ